MLSLLSTLALADELPALHLDPLAVRVADSDVPFELEDDARAAAERLGYRLDESSPIHLSGALEVSSCSHKTPVMACEFLYHWDVHTASGESALVFHTRGEALVLADEWEEAARVGASDATTRALERTDVQAVLRGMAAREAAPLDIQRCATRYDLPAQAEDTLAAVGRIQTPDGSGSGLVISPDGFVLTALHVVDDHDELVWVGVDGTEETVEVIKANQRQDVALLKLAGRDDRACIAVAEAPPKLASSVWGIGNPLGEELAFTVAAGIVGGLRTIEGHPVVQTDSPVNPGMSGGPLLDDQGRAVGVTSFKVALEGVEGLGFATRTDGLEDALGFTWAASSTADAELPRPLDRDALPSDNLRGPWSGFPEIRAATGLARPARFIGYASVTVGTMTIAATANEDMPRVTGVGAILTIAGGGLLAGSTMLKSEARIAARSDKAELTQDAVVEAR